MFPTGNIPGRVGAARAALAGVLLLVALGGRPALAQSISFDVDDSTLSFPLKSPDTATSIAATQNPVTFTVNVTGAAYWTLTISMAGDLRSGANTIPVSGITWTASGTDFYSGSLSASSAQTLGFGSGSGTKRGTFNFFLANDWQYATGSYSQFVTVTATAF